MNAAALTKNFFRFFFPGMRKGILTASLTKSNVHFWLLVKLASINGAGSMARREKAGPCRPRV